MLNRRHFLSTLAAACAGGAATTTLPKLAFAQTSGEARFVFVQFRACHCENLLHADLGRLGS